MIPGRASDAGPVCKSHCPRCEASLAKRDLGICVACEEIGCDACGQFCDDGFWCSRCLEKLIAKITAEMRADMRDVECGAPFSNSSISL